MTVILERALRGTRWDKSIQSDIQCFQTVTKCAHCYDDDDDNIKIIVKILKMTHSQENVAVSITKQQKLIQTIKQE